MLKLSRLTRWARFAGLAAILLPVVLAVVLAGATPVQATGQAPVALGTAANFTVLGGAGVTCTESTVTGVVGSLLTVTQTPTCTIAGTILAADAVTAQAFADFLVAYAALAAVPCPTDADHNLSGDLGGKVLSPGVYCISGVGLLTSQLTLDGPSDGVWIFKAGTSLTPIGGSVVMAGGGQPSNVYWQPGTEVSLDATKFQGNILAGSAITFTGVGSSLDGRALAKTAVTMTGTTIGAAAVPPVAVTPTPTPTPVPPTPTPTPTPATGQAPVALGTAANFTVLGGAGVTCTESTVTGVVGSLLTVTQTPTCTIAGTILAADAVTAQAFADFLVAYAALAATPSAPANNLTGQQLGGMTLAPGVYSFNTTADLTTGQLTLKGPSNGIWIFQIGTGITTGTASVVMAGGGQPSNVYWQVGTAATIGDSTAFQGNILAGSAITFTGAQSSLVGRALAQTAVTLTGATISAAR
ncbi:MAG: ice-binding family protein [Pseudomonadota bacterium]